MISIEHSEEPCESGKKRRRKVKEVLSEPAEKQPISPKAGNPSLSRIFHLRDEDCDSPWHR